jgi:phosphoglycerol transferase MdoB-like AlkP superfamily enzyme
MRQSNFTYLWHIIKQLLVVMILMTLCRILFYWCNTNLYNELTLRMIVGGFRFDAVVVVIANGLFILSGLLPFSYRFSNWYYKVYRLLFVPLNGLLLALNLIDVAYVGFTKKRSSIDLFTTQGLGNDIVQLAPQFATDYWYLLIIFVFFLWLLYKIIKPFNFQKTSPLFEYVILFFVLGFSVLIQRGGLQAKPLLVIHANQYTTSNQTPVVLNTPFTILRSIGSTILQVLPFFTEEELKQYINPIKTPSNQKNTTLLKAIKPNICLIILESFGYENIGALTGEKTYTPFIDSLIEHSLNFSNAYANGQRSIESLPSLLASLPSLMEQPYITSPYAANEITGLGTHLKSMGYTTSFFHGGQNGTMGFDLFSKQAGFDNYYGKNEYEGKSTDDDGNWGIFDEPFLQYMAKQLNAFQEPFASTIFTLSSHHPFIIPKQHRDKFTGGHNELQNSMQYTDYALRQFFKTARKQPWFNNTLFIITADHSSISEDQYYYSNAATFMVPLFIYSPELITPKNTTTLIQHLDLMPTVLSFLNYNKSYIAFGSSVSEPESNRIVINRKSNMWQIQNDSLLLRFDGNNVKALYNLSVDSACTNNIITKKDQACYYFLENKLKAYLQTYNQLLIDNALVINE